MSVSTSHYFTSQWTISPVPCTHMCHPCTCLHRIHIYTPVLLLEQVEDMQNMPLVTPSTGSVLSTQNIICKCRFVTFCCPAELNKIIPTILKTNISAFSAGYAIFPIWINAAGTFGPAFCIILQQDISPLLYIQLFEYDHDHVKHGNQLGRLPWQNYVNWFKINLSSLFFLCLIGGSLYVSTMDICAGQ